MSDDTSSNSAKNTGGADPVTTDKRPDPRAALPPGTLKGPFLGRQGDENRQPSEAELRRLAEIQAKQNGDLKP